MMKITGKEYPARKQHTKLISAMRQAMQDNAGDLSAEEVLACASQLVGNLSALQDQRKYTSQAVMTMIARNIEIGNQAVVAGLVLEQANTKPV